jgi:adenosylcobinamide-phosphate synthase
MTSASILVAALLLDAVLGEPDWLWSRCPHPAVIMGRMIDWCDRRFNGGSWRRLKGVLVIGALVLAAAATGYVISLGGPVLEILTAAVLLAQKSLVQHVQGVADGLRGSIGEGRQMVARIVSRDTTGMDEPQIARAAIESAAENLSDGVVAPAFWLLVGGLPGLIVYKLVNTADSMIGYRTPKHDAFGWAAARLDDGLNLIPARLTALFIALIGGVRDAAAIRGDARRHKSPNAGWPEAAMSRALGIALAGPRSYHGQQQDLPWVNPTGRRALTADDIDSAAVMLWKAWGLMLVLVLGIALANW